MVDVNDFTREATCEYKGELYSIRDNGAVMRHQRDDKKARKLDNVWTFGKKSDSNGYMMINSHRVHIIVAKAFIPGNEDGKMVVDHIDTNRCNNRVENLRWVTRLENVLLNEATLKRVTYLCGGDINKFLNDPSCLRDLSDDNQDIMWMRTVTAEEAKKAWEHISAWSKRPNSTYKMMKQREQTADFDEWLKKHNGNKQQSSQETNFNYYSAPKSTDVVIREQNEKSQESTLKRDIKESLTKGALQYNFGEKMWFPLCPKEGLSGGLDAYVKKLEIGKVIGISEKGDEVTITSLGWTWEWDAIQIEYKINEVKHSHCIHISFEDGEYIHSLGSYERSYRFCESSNVLQCGAVTQCSFPLCPKDGNTTLEEYANILQKNTLFERNQYCDCYVYDREFTTSEDGTTILYVGVRMEDSIKPYGDMIIFTENGKIIHQRGRTFFDEKALQRTFCRIRGQEWDDNEDVFDDYC